jgi:O-acetyl-ADP-ribose deacetylase (regulator of RNase III)
MGQPNPEVVKMSLVVVKGDLLQSDCHVIAHQANCFSSMEAGIAKQIKQIYPEAYQADRDFPYPPEERLGKISVAKVDTNRYVVNLYGQYHYDGPGPKTDYAALEKALIEMFDYDYEGINNPKFGVPFNIGCGLAGGNWGIVSEILDRVSEQFKQTIYAYKLE